MDTITRVVEKVKKAARTRNMVKEGIISPRIALNSTDKSILRRELSAKRKLKKRSPEEWCDLLKEIPKKHRSQVAKIIWWDWFGDRNVWERWPHLDRYIKPNEYVEIKDEKFVEYLLKLGYTPYMAHTRIVK